MSGYIGTRCMICSEKFTSADDVVVCPECGTPYHRDCYEKEGKCVNSVLHKTGGSWKPSYDTGSDGSENQAVACRFCGNTNPPLTLFCRRCGMPVSTIRNENDTADQTSGGVNINENADAYNRNFNGGVQMNPFLINFSDPLCGFDPEEQLDGVKMSELGDFVGTNTHYYLPIFKRFKETRRSASWNFCSALFPELYFSYRKMPLAALAAVIIRQITQLPQYIVLLSQSIGLGRLSELAASVDIRSAAFQGFLVLCSVMMYAFMFTAGIFGNKLYYSSAVRKIKRTKESADPRIPRDMLRGSIIGKGGTSGLLLTLFICLTALPTLMLFYSQMIPMMSGGV